MYLALPEFLQAWQCHMVACADASGQVVDGAFMLSGMRTEAPANLAESNRMACCILRELETLFREAAAAKPWKECGKYLTECDIVILSISSLVCYTIRAIKQNDIEKKKPLLEKMYVDLGVELSIHITQTDDPRSQRLVQDILEQQKKISAAIEHISRKISHRSTIIFATAAFIAVVFMALGIYEKWGPFMLLLLIPLPLYLHFKGPDAYAILGALLGDHRLLHESGDLMTDIRSETNEDLRHLYKQSADTLNASKSVSGDDTSKS